jgi:hypothetical protein
MRFWSTLTACGLAAAAAASELHPVDLRVSLMMAPETEDIDVTYRVPGLGVSGSTDGIDAGWRFEAGLATVLAGGSSNVRLIGGAWFFYSNQENDAVEPGEREIPVMTGPMDYMAMGIDLYIALNLRVTRHIEVEFGPFVGIGATRYTDSGVEAGNEDGRVEETGHGEYEEAGLALAITLRPPSRRFLVSLGVRALTSRGEAENAFDTEDEDGNLVSDGLIQEVEIRQNGFTPYLTVGMTF